MAREYFYEKQTFSWIWPLLIPMHVILLFILVYGTYKQFYLGEPFGNTPMSNKELIVFNTCIILFIALFDYFLLHSMYLEIKIDSSGIHYRYPPMINKWKTLQKEEIEYWEVGKYYPLRDYGGWGYRISFRRKKGKALNVYGNKGLTLQLKNGKTLVLGTRQQEKLKAAMDKLFQTEDNYV